MNKRIISLLTAVFMALTIFAVPTAEIVTAATTDDAAAVEEYAVTDATVAGDEAEAAVVQTEVEKTSVEAAADQSDETIESTEPTDPEEPDVTGPVNIADATVTTAQADYEFTKEEVTPAVTVKLNGETLVEGTDFEVSYSNNIYPGTANITVTGINDYEGTVTKTFGIATVKGLIWKKSTTTSIKLDWNTRKNVTGYNVYRYNFSESKWVYLKTVKNSEATVNNLTPGTGYQFRVRSIYKDDKTYYSPVSKTIQIPTTPNQVTVKSLVNHPSLYVKMTWGKRNSTGYQVKLARNSTFTKVPKTFKVTSSTKLYRKITNLKDNQQYYIKVRAYKTYGNKTVYGKWSKSKAFSTNGTRWYNVSGKKYYYKKGKKVTGKMMFGKHQYFFNYEDGAWSGASSTMWNKVKNSSSKTKYLIAVSRELNRLCVYEGKKGDWTLKYYWMCSTGAPKGNSISKTPTGSWLMPKEDNHLGYIGGHKTYTCWYATRFYNRCFFHSVLYQPASKTQIQDGRLGMNISDGCIRMNIDDAKWIYDNCHTGTRVIVY